VKFHYFKPDPGYDGEGRDIKAPDFGVQRSLFKVSPCDSDSKTIPAYRRQGPQTIDFRPQIEEEEIEKSGV